MKLTLPLLALLALTGCATCKRHEVACAVIVGSIALSAPALIRGHSGSTSTREPEMSIPLVPNCQVYPELCR